MLVVPLVTTRAIGRALSYAPPPAGAPPPGALVRVPLAGRSVRGVVVPATGEAHEGELREIEAVLDPDAVSEGLLQVALWIASYYGSTPARALPLVLPPRTRPRGERWASAVPAAEGGTPTRRAVLEALADGPRLVSELVEAVPTTAPTLRLMHEVGLIRIERRLAAPAAVPHAARPDPTPDQAAAIARVEGLLAKGAGGELLLHGVTGSGKTEVFLRAVEACLAMGRGAIVLVPEIALTPQTAERIAGRLGARVAVLHSALADGERAAALSRLRTGEADVAVGPRSAVFAPVLRLGLVVIDEEHDAGYKQSDDPRYDARSVALRRARLEGAVLLACSATPRPESWRALARVSLPRRIGGPLPRVQVVDLRRDLYPLSRPLRERLLGLVADGGRGILLLNRRGQSPALHCRACGRGFRCERCDVALSLHAGGRLRCHHCGHSERAPSRCPSCGAMDIERLGAGTQRVAEAVEELCGSGLSVLRLDTDAVARRGTLERTLAHFRAERAAVLVGTQMVAKGHHFEGVALAAVVDADTGLAQPDFRAEERTFQLLTQLAGRSGRDAPGRVLIQTFQPDARPIALAARHDVGEFLAGELERRRALGYPPFRHLVRILVSGPEAGAPLQALTELRAGLAGADLLGPAPLLRLRGRHRAQLLAKTDRPRGVAARAARLLSAAAPAMRRAGLSAVVDVDPQTL